MHEWVGRWPDNLVTDATDLEPEFEARLQDSSGLAFSIAYGVLRNRADAEEVAQEAFVEVASQQWAWRRVLMPAPAAAVTMLIVTLINALA